MCPRPCENRQGYMAMLKYSISYAQQVIKPMFLGGLDLLRVKISSFCNTLLATENRYNGRNGDVLRVSFSVGNRVCEVVNGSYCIVDGFLAYAIFRILICDNG